MLAEITAQLLAKVNGDVVHWIKDHKGTYHLAGRGAASRFEWAQAIIELDPHNTAQVVREVLPALTADFSTPARRPLYSALNYNRFVSTFGLSLPDWKSSLLLAMDSQK